MIRILSQFVPTVRKVRVLQSVGWTLFFPLSRPKNKLQDMESQMACSCGKGLLCLRNSLVLNLWMSGPGRPESFEKSFVRISKKSFDVGVKAFGSIMTVYLRISRGGTI